MVKISVMMSTVRNNYPLSRHPDTFIFDPTIKSLQQQTFKDFEFVLMDYRKDIRKGLMKPDYGFAMKHERPKASVWDNKRYPAIYNGFNSAIIHSDGELCVLVGDCCELSPKFLERCWYWYEKGYFAVGIVDVENANRTDDQFRKKLLQSREYCQIDGRQATWGYNSYSLEALFKVNGFDENFDGSNHEGDDDIGVRLGMAGYKFILDGSMKALEYQHVNPHQLQDYLCGKKAKNNDLYFNFKWRTPQPIRANDGKIDRKGFKEYLNGDFLYCKQYFRSIEDYRNIRAIYDNCPSNFDLKLLWQQRKGLV